MTNRLELNWKLDVIVDEQKYYISEISIDVNNPPTPKNILSGDVRSYIDTDIKIGKKKYIIVSSIKNTNEKFSSEKLTYCLPTQPKVWSEFKINLLDDFGTIWTAIGGATVVNNALNLVRSSGQRVESPHSNKFHFPDGGDVTIRFKAKISNFSSDRRVLFSTRIDGSNGAKNWCIYAVPNGIILSIWRSDISGVIINKTWASSYQFNEETEFSLERKNMVWILYINGVKFGDSVTQSTNYTPVSQKLTIGSEFNTDSSGDKSRDLDGEISMFQILPLAIGDGGPTTPRI